MDDFDQVIRANGPYADELYRRYLADPKAAGERWALFFAGFDVAAGGDGSRSAVATARTAPLEAKEAAGVAAEPEALVAPAAGPCHEAGLHSIHELVHSFRELGHYSARLDPLEEGPPEDHPCLAEAISHFGEGDLERPVIGAGGLRGVETPTVGEMIERLRATYCGTLGVQYLDLFDPAQRDWLEERMEPGLNQPHLSREERTELFRRLVAAA